MNPPTQVFSLCLITPPPHCVDVPGGVFVTPVRVDTYTCIILISAVYGARSAHVIPGTAPPVLNPRTGLINRNN